MKYYIHQVLKGLEYLHSKKIIHKDIKLQNLLLSEDMQIKICDFGFAMKHRSRGLVSGGYCGTEMYVAPEIYRKQKYTFTVDIWATGVTAFTLLYGYYPFCKKKGQVDAEKIITGKFNFPKSKYVNNTRENEVIKNMLNTDLLQRPSAVLLLESPYFKTGYIPKRLSDYCIWAEPKFIDNTSMRVSQLLPDIMGMLSDITGNPDEKVGCSSYQSKSQPKENQLAKRTVKQKRSIAKSGENISDSHEEDDEEEKGLADESVNRKKAKITPRMAEKRKKSIIKKTSNSKSSAIEKNGDSPKIETRSTSRDRATVPERRSGLLAKTVTTPVKSSATTKAPLTKQIAVKQTVVKKVLPKTVKEKKREKFESPALKTVLEKSGQSKVEQHKSRYHKSEPLKPETKPGPSKKHTSGKSSKTKMGCSSYQSESQPKENQLAKRTVKQKRSIAKSGENISDSQEEDEEEEKGLADESVKRKKAKVTPRIAEKRKKSIIKKTSNSKSSAIEKNGDSPKIETRSTSRDRATAPERRSGLLAKTVTTPVKSSATTKAPLTKQIAVKQTVVKKVLPKTVKEKKREKFESPALKTVLEKSGQSKVEQHKSRYHKSEPLKPETKPGPSKKHTSGKSSKTKSCNYPEVLPSRYIKRTYLLDNGNITYELSDGRSGIHFNDHTIIQVRGASLEWIEKDMMFNIDLKKTVHFMFGDKIQQLESADRRLRTRSGITCGVSISPPPRGGDYAYLKRFYTTSHGIVYVLSDGTIQFEHEGEERAFIIICPRNKSITLVEGLSKRWSYSICDLKTREFVIPGLSYLKLMISALHSITSRHK